MEDTVVRVQRGECGFLVFNNSDCSVRFGLSNYLTVKSAVWVWRRVGHGFLLVSFFFLFNGFSCSALISKFISF